MRTKTFLVIMFWGTLSLYAQNKVNSDSIYTLKEVIYTGGDRLLYPFSKTQQTQNLSQAVIRKNANSLTQLLNQNSNIYFRENGFGMVSSPSFRGTTAQQTAVIWNGININSNFTGLTDFNAINSRNFNDITVRSGGGSVIYGSGAIGGSIHLNDNISFNEGFESDIFLGYGSFNTKDITLRSNYSDDKISIGASVVYTSSDNDFEYELNRRDRENLNGEFFNVGFTTQLAYKISSNHILKHYNYIFNGERNFSLISPSETPTVYRDFNTRQMLEWEAKMGKVSSVLRGAYLTEKYKYYPNIETNNFSFGEAKTYIGNHQLGFKPTKNINFLAVQEINNTKGEGSNVQSENRTIYSSSFLLNQKIKAFYYEASVRKEITNEYESPLLFSLGLNYNFGKNYTLNLNGSKNFRIPTFNDLYWEGQGNPDLNPETSHQIEIGNEFELGSFRLNLTGYYNNIEDMIRWVPNSSGIWRPINTDHVITYGLETNLNFNKKIGNNHLLKLNSGYAYTVSENQDNNNQLIYVPFHKANFSFNYGYKNWNTFFQGVFVGEVFIQSDNNPNRVVDPYFVANLGCEYQFSKKLIVGVRLQNLFNTNYQVSLNRGMPGFNSNFFINFNI